MDKYTAPLPNIKSNLIVPQSMANQEEGEEKMRIFEVRLGLTEKSNRALLDEVIRLQNELQLLTQSREHTLREETKARHYLENSLRDTNSLISQMSHRIRTAEEHILNDHTSLKSMRGHTKAMEDKSVHHQDDASIKREQNKLVALEIDLEDVQRGRFRVEHVAAQLAEKVSQLKNRVDHQNSEYASVLQELRQKARHLEMEFSTSVQYMKKIDSIAAQEHSVILNQSALRNHIEARFSDLHNVIGELRTKQELEKDERRILEQRMVARFCELQETVLEQSRKQEKIVVDIQKQSTTQEYTNDTERHTQKHLFDRVLSEMPARIEEREIVLRGEIEGRYRKLEQLIKKQAFENRDKELNQQNLFEQHFVEMKRMVETQLVSVGEQTKKEKLKIVETFKRLDGALFSIEKQLEERKITSDRMLIGEINFRKMRDREISARMLALEEKIVAATTTLQQRILQKNVSFDNSAKSNVQLQREVEKQRIQLERLVSEFDARLSNLSSQLDAGNSLVESGTFNSATQGNNFLQKKMQSMSAWQVATDNCLNNMKSEDDSLREELTETNKKLAQVEKNIKEHLAIETASRQKDVQSLRLEIQDYLINQSPTKDNVQNSNGTHQLTR